MMRKKSQPLKISKLTLSKVPRAGALLYAYYQRITKFPS